MASLAANNGFTLGIRAPGQTYSQCLADPLPCFRSRKNMASAVQFGSNGVKAGGQAAAAGSGMIAGSPFTGSFAPAVATAGGLVASGAATYSVLSVLYEAFWQGSGYLSGCNAYGYSF